MKRIFFRFNLLGCLFIAVGLMFIIFNIPLYAWLILVGAILIVTGIYLCK